MNTQDHRSMPARGEQPLARLHIAIDALGTPTGGGITYVRNLLRELAELRPQFRFTLFYSLPTLAEGLADNVECVQIPKAGGLWGRWAWEQTKLRGELRERGADVLICMNGFSCFTTSLPQIALWQNANLVRRVKISMSRGMRLRFWVQRQLQRVSVLKASRNIFLTQHFADLAATWFPIGRVRRDVVHSGIDLERMTPADEWPTDDEREVLAVSVGHTYFHKNYETLIDAMALLRDRGSALQLAIVGAPEDPAYHEELGRRIQRLDLGDRIEMSGVAGPEAVASYYRRARIYVTTSLLESFGLTPLEAMANGVPSLVPNESCFPEVCGDAALYCDPRNPQDVANQLEAMTTNAALRERLREKGHQQVERFSWARCAEGVLDHIEDIVPQLQESTSPDSATHVSKVKA